MAKTTALSTDTELVEAGPTESPSLPSGLTVAVVSAVRLLREGLTLSLRGRSRIGAVRPFGTTGAHLAALPLLRPDVVLLDLGGADPATAARGIRLHIEGSRLVAFALAEGGEAVFACAASGFDGYVPCDGGAEEVYRAVLDAADGRMHCTPDITAAMFGRLAHLLQPPGTARGGTGLSPLTGREREILVLAEQGGSNKDIARRLAISSATVKNHMHSILQKLQVSRRGQAAAQLRNNVSASSVSSL